MTENDIESTGAKTLLEDSQSLALLKPFKIISTRDMDVTPNCVWVGVTDDEDVGGCTRELSTPAPTSGA